MQSAKLIYKLKIRISKTVKSKMIGKRSDKVENTSNRYTIVWGTHSGKLSGFLRTENTHLKESKSEIRQEYIGGMREYVYENVVRMIDVR
jgi:hypothetical protein